MINYIWFFFIIVGLLYSLISGNKSVTDNFLNSGNIVIGIIFNMIPLICLWLGIMKIAEKSGLLNILSKKLSKLIRFIFPELSRDDVVISYISSNIIMNMLSLGSAATPFGLKAMKELQILNKNKEVPTRSMITFLAINTSSVTLIPTTVLSLITFYKGVSPSSIVAPIILTTILSTLLALIIDFLFYKLWSHFYD